MSRTLRIATRGSAQARTQAESVAAEIRSAHPAVAVELVFVETTGDQRQDVPLHTIGGQGVFVKEVQRALLDGRADLAAHSAKDLPSTAADGLRLAAFCRRRDPADAMVGLPLGQLHDGAVVATGSVRRRAQIGEARPDIRFEELRGNIATRLSKVPDHGSIVMAVAALEILGLTERIAERLPVDVFVPAVGQGCVAVECRVDDDEVAELLLAVDHPDTRTAVEIERAFLATLGSGCSLPVGAHAADGRLHAFLADPPSGRVVRSTIELGTGALDEAVELARRMQREVDGR